MKEVDFTPQWYRLRRQRRVTLRRRLLMVGLLVASMGTWTLWKQAELRRATLKLSALQMCHAQQQPEVEHALSLTAALRMEQDREHLFDLCSGGAAQHQILAEMSRCFPASAFLNRLRVVQEDRLTAPEADVERSGSTPRRGKVPHLNVELGGCAVEHRDVGKLVEALSASPLFVEVELAYSRPEMVDGREVREFEIRCRLPQFR